MLVSKSSAMHQLRRRSAQKPQLDLIADRMPLACIGHKSLRFTDAGCGSGTHRATPENSVERPFDSLFDSVILRRTMSPDRLMQSNLGFDCVIR